MQEFFDGLDNLVIDVAKQIAADALGTCDTEYNRGLLKKRSGVPRTYY